MLVGKVRVRVWVADMSALLVACSTLRQLHRSVTDEVQSLGHGPGAMNESKSKTPTGWALARLPRSASAPSSAFRSEDRSASDVPPSYTRTYAVSRGHSRQGVR